jgi:tetratricopeptide (TPR) repeat protein
VKHTPYIVKVIILLLGLSGHLHLTAQDRTTEQLALQYFNAGEFEKAAELYGELFRQTPNTFYYNYYLNALLESGQFREAERVVKGLKPTRELRRNFTVELGYIYMQQGEMRRAEREFERAIERMESTRMGVTDLANAFLIRRLPEYAMRVYLQGRRVIPEGYLFHIELANVYQSMRNYPAMMDEYLDMLGTDETRITLVQNTLQHLMNAFNDESFNQVIRSRVIERAQRYPDKIIYSELLLWYSIQQKEFTLALTQARAMERRTRDEGEGALRIGELAAANGFYDVAIEAFEHIKRKGESHFLYHRAEMLLLEARFSRMMTMGTAGREEINSLGSEYERLIDRLGRRNNTITLIRNYAHLLAFYLEEHQKAIELLEEAISIPNVGAAVTAQCKIDLADIYLMNGEVWEATLLYSQVEKAFKYDPVGFEAKLKNARLSFYIGEFEWAKNQLDVLRAATSKLIANDAMELSLLIADNLDDDENIVPLSMFARAHLYVFRKRPDLALPVLDSLSRLFPGHNIQDEVLLKKAEIMISRRQYAEADSLLEQLLNQYGHDILADNAVITRARLHDFHLRQPAKAMDFYEQLINEHPGSVFIEEARRRYRELRSTTIN